MTPFQSPVAPRRHQRVGWGVPAGVIAAALILAGCAVSPSADAMPTNAADAPEASTAAEAPATDAPSAVPVESPSQEETCDWESPRVSLPAEDTASQEGDLTEVLVGSWQHTHTDEGAGFEEVVNDHRYVFPSPDRMLYCQHVPGATEYAENAANVVLNGTTIELPGGKYGYTVMAWDQDTLVWDNPVGGGYVYLLQRR